MKIIYQNLTGKPAEFVVVAETELSIVGRRNYESEIVTAWEALFDKKNEGKTWFSSLEAYEANEAKQAELKARIAEIEKEFA